MTRRIFFKLLGAFLLVIVAGTVTLDFAIRRAWEASLRNEIERELVEKAQLFAGRVQSDKSHTMQEVAVQAAREAQARATIIDSTGKVLADSEASPATMENHASRPEVAAALHGQVGSSVRLSHTVHTNLLYVAVPIPGGAVRLAYPLAAIEQTTAQVRSTLLQGSALALVVAMLLAGLTAHFTSRRLNRIVKFAERVAAGDLSARISESSLDEIGQVAAALDTTARKLQLSFAEIERIEKTRRDFVANVSHELRTPLTSIQGYTETLLEAGESPPNREFLEAIRRNTARMSRLTEDLLTLARVESGERHFQLVPVTAADLLRDAQQSFCERAKAKGMELRIEGLAPRAVAADPEAIHQVLANLIDNALKYAAEGKRVELASREIDGAIEFSVRDFGPGILAEHLPRLFERFYRVDPARSRESGGTGLGLAIVKHIVLHHGGTVRATSEPGRGSTFYFALPLATVPANAPPV